MRRRVEFLPMKIVSPEPPRCACTLTSKELSLSKSKLTVTWQGERLDIEINLPIKLTKVVLRKGSQG